MFCIGSQNHTTFYSVGSNDSIRRSWIPSYKSIDVEPPRAISAYFLRSLESKKGKKLLVLSRYLKPTRDIDAYRMIHFVLYDIHICQHSHLQCKKSQRLKSYNPGQKIWPKLRKTALYLTPQAMYNQFKRPYAGSVSELYCIYRKT